MNSLLTALNATGLAFVLAAAFIALVSLPRHTARSRPTDEERAAARRRAATYLRSARHQTAMNRLLADIRKGEQ